MYEPERHDAPFGPATVAMMVVALIPTHVGPPKMDTTQPWMPEGPSSQVCSLAPSAAERNDPRITVVVPVQAASVKSDVIRAPLLGAAAAKLLPMRSAIAVHVDILKGGRGMEAFICDATVTVTMTPHAAGGRGGGELGAGGGRGGGRKQSCPYSPTRQVGPPIKSTISPRNW